MLLPVAKQYPKSFCLENFVFVLSLGKKSSLLGFLCSVWQCSTNVSSKDQRKHKIRYNMIRIANDDHSCLISVNGQVCDLRFQNPPLMFFGSTFWSTVTTELSVSWVFSGSRAETVYISGPWWNFAILYMGINVFLSVVKSFCLPQALHPSQHNEINEQHHLNAERRVNHCLETGTDCCLNS